MANFTISIFSAQPYDREFLTKANQSAQFASHPFTLEFHAFPLSEETVPLAQASDAVCVFVNDVLDAAVLKALHSNGTRAVLLRCAGFNNVDLVEAEKLGMFVANVPAYAPEAVAEYAVALMQTLNRQTHRAYNRVREGNFSLVGLMGFTMHGKTVGVVGTGKIGIATARILRGFGCRILGFDPYPGRVFEGADIGGRYVTLDELLRESDVVTLHCPLGEGTRHIINEETLAKMKDGAMLVNTSRGGLIDTPAVITALKHRKLGSLAIDVYEQESALFYQDHSSEIITDDILSRLATFPNVIVSGHQGFFTKEALEEIAGITLSNASSWRAEIGGGGEEAKGRGCENRLLGRHVAPK